MQDRDHVRLYGDDVWRPGTSNQVVTLAAAVAFVAASGWLLQGWPELTIKDVIAFVASDLAVLLLVPLVLFRWRMVLEYDELIIVFARTRRVPLRSIVDARFDSRRGLVFVRDDGTQESFGALAHKPGAHTKPHPTRADLAARTVLCAAAR